MVQERATLGRRRAEADGCATDVADADILSPFLSLSVGMCSNGFFLSVDFLDDLNRWFPGVCVATGR